MNRKKEAYEYIKRKITSNELPQGAPIREVELAEALHMSRTPIREALRELESEGVIISYPARGTFVSTISPYDVEEISELRTLCELWALERGFERYSTDELDRLNAAFAAAYSPFDWERFHQVDRVFHAMVIEKSGSKRLAAFVATLNSQTERVRSYGARDPARQLVTLSEHREIIEAIRRRDLPAAREALRVHLDHVGASAIESCRALECAEASLRREL